MSEDWNNRIKKLALAYETGWEYMAKSDEAGSVLTDVFLEMEGKNRESCRGMWKKHKLEFLQAVPAEDSEAKRLRTALVVRATDRDSGKFLKKGTKAYTLLEKEGIIRFRTCSDLMLTPARLRYGIYKKGLSAWLAYDSGAEDGEDSYPVRLFQPVGSELEHPVFEWSFSGLCVGRERLAFDVEFYGADKTAGINGSGGSSGIEGDDLDFVLSGKWSVTDGQEVYPLSLERTDTAFVLKGETPGFAERLDGERYTIRLEFPAGEEPPQVWQEALCRDIALRETAETVEVKLCLTDEGTAESGCVRPFGQALYEASCCYFVCDRAVAGREGELELKFTESFETEEELPEPPPQEYEKLYKKYPWMRLDQTVQEWRAENTVWEYFNGSLWCILPGSRGWATGCLPEASGEKAYRWTRPQDMQPCAVEGEEHFYIRLRLISVCNAFAVYYHKHIPVLKDVRFETGERTLKPVARKLPDRDEWQEAKMCLGFDQRVTSENTWYTGTECLVFRQRQIQGNRAGYVKQTRYGREAFWVELEGGAAEDWETLMPNYVEILQEKDPQEDRPGGGRSTHLQIPAAADFTVETDGMEVLEAVSVSESRYNGDGPPIEGQMRVKAAEHYFSHYGRLVTLYDVELLLQERYPFLELESCALREDVGELQVSLRQVSAFQGGTWELLQEISEWLKETASRTGTLWLKGINVNCTLSSEEITHNAGENIIG